ncbi:MAG TPA: FIST N-terminal domain-containing protein [Kofleriaceae bacterium]
MNRPLGAKAQLALAFAPTARLTEHETWAELIGLYPGARIVGCSTAGEIAGRACSTTRWWS